MNTEGDSIGESLVTVTLRPLHVDDAEMLADLYTKNREFLAPTDPARPGDFFTVAGQRRGLRMYERDRAADLGYRFLIEADAQPVGVMSVSRITRGPFQNAGLGYWVAEHANGRGVATQAVGWVCEWGFSEGRLHRLEAATLVDNIASQTVLRRNRFTEIGRCPRYLHIAGAWRDHLLFARTIED
ncbi:MAG: GNAT family N-acetyltransferase [Gaiellales bacterium]